MTRGACLCYSARSTPLKGPYNQRVSPEDLISIGLAKELVIIVLSALPVIELRGSLPLAINVFNFPWYYALPLAVLGNMLPVPLIMLFLNAVTRLLSKIAFFERLLRWFFDHTRKRGKLVEKYERIGLALFVAVPLPLTGAWSGAVASVIFGLGAKQAMLSIFIGVCIAGIIVTSLSLLGWLGAVIAGLVLGGWAAFGLWKSNGRKPA